MEKEAKIYVAGHRGLVGSALVKTLKERGYSNLLCRTSAELDLRNQENVERFFSQESPDYVLLAAAKVGGIHANMTYPAQFIYDNLQIQTNVIHSAFKAGVKKLLFLGSACIYPTQCKQPIKEEELMTGKFEPTNEPYAIAKVAGIGMCQAYHREYGKEFISVIPSNLFGPGDNFHPQNSHLMAALIKKFHDAKIQGREKTVLWGTGNPRRDVLYSEDAADACLFLMDNYDSEEIINIGVGRDNSVRELAKLVRDAVGYNGEIEFDASKPDGMMQRVLDVSKVNALGWHAKTNLDEGIKQTYEWFLQNGR